MCYLSWGKVSLAPLAVICLRVFKAVLDCGMIPQTATLPNHTNHAAWLYEHGMDYLCKRRCMFIWQKLDKAAIIVVCVITHLPADDGPPQPTEHEMTSRGSRSRSLDKVTFCWETQTSNDKQPVWSCEALVHLLLDTCVHVHNDWGRHNIFCITLMASDTEL